MAENAICRICFKALKDHKLSEILACFRELEYHEVGTMRAELEIRLAK